jgi:hypothetical protein
VRSTWVAAETQALTQAVTQRPALRLPAVAGPVSDLEPVAFRDEANRSRELCLGRGKRFLAGWTGKHVRQQKAHGAAGRCYPGNLAGGDVLSAGRNRPGPEGGFRQDRVAGVDERQEVFGSGAIA